MTTITAKAKPTTVITTKLTITSMTICDNYIHDHMWQCDCGKDGGDHGHEDFGNKNNTTISYLKITSIIRKSQGLQVQ